MIFITGDTHIPIDIHKLSSKRFPQQKSMTKDDHLIICGDFGGVWDGSREEKYWIKWLENKNFTTLFVDGNHENFDILNDLPLEDLGGEKVHRIGDGIYHLMRGRIYKIEDQTFFTFGGASSHDKKFRKEGKNWWSTEMPNLKEFDLARKNLYEYDFQIDYIITHTAPETIQNMIASEYEKNELTKFLDEVRRQTCYRKWFFGHYHKDICVTEKDIAVFDSIIEL